MASVRVLLTGTAVGLVFAVLDGALNANPLAQRLYSVYKPILRDSVNAPLGLLFDLISGLVMAALFAALAPALPGSSLAKGLCFGLIVWFFRVAMGAAGQAVMFRIPGSALAYTLGAGLMEMAILGALCSFALKSV